MSRGGSAGGGKSSLGYLFGDGEPPKPAAVAAVKAPPAEKPASIPLPTEKLPPPTEKPAPISPPADAVKQIPAGIQGSQTNNYFRAEGQNTGNFLTDRRSTKVQADPGGSSSLSYLFGGK